MKNNVKKALTILIMFAMGFAVYGQTSEAEMVVDVAEQMPEFPGGQKALAEWIANEINTPADTIIYGKVYVQFIIDKYGVINDSSIVIARGLHPSYDNEVIRMIKKMPDWEEPARQRGQAVACRFTIPISFNK